MKRVKSSRSAVTRKTAPNTVAGYLATIPKQSRDTFLQLRNVIRSAVLPEAEEVISYGIPAFKHERILVWFAAFANHCSLFPTAAVIQEFRNDLKGFSISKGTIHFPIDKRLPKALIKKLVKARVADAIRMKRKPSL